MTGDAVHDDARRFDWLEADGRRLGEVYRRMENSGDDLRAAIDALMAMDGDELKP